MPSASLSRPDSISIPWSMNSGRGISICPLRLARVMASCFCLTFSSTALLRLMIEYHFRGPSVNGTTSLSASRSANSAGLPMIWIAPCLFTQTGGSVTFSTALLGRTTLWRVLGFSMPAILPQTAPSFRKIFHLETPAHGRLGCPQRSVSITNPLLIWTPFRASGSPWKAVLGLYKHEGRPSRDALHDLTPSKP
jgi:hypothetical protein